MDNYSASLDPVFHALADPTRRAVVQQLVLGEASISHLAKPHAMALPSFMKHVAVLEQAGLIETRKSGRVRHCRLNAARLAACEAWFADQRRAWHSRFDHLDSLLTDLQAGEPT